MSDTVPKRIPNQDYTKLVLKKCEDNHIWLNKMAYISPTLEQRLALADTILEKLRTKSTQIPESGITDEDETMRKLAELTPVLFLKVNWS